MTDMGVLIIATETRTGTARKRTASPRGPLD